MPTDPIQPFIDRWTRSGGAEQANYQLFLSELCDLLEVPRPEPTTPDDDDNAYVFERRVVFLNPDGTQTYGRIDLYKRGCFVLETKQGVEQQDAVVREPSVVRGSPDPAQVDRRSPDLAQPLSAAGRQRQKKRKKGHGRVGTAAWNDTLLRARGQAEAYARSLTGKETRPPFLAVVDVAHTIDLYAEFTQTGGSYIPFPDPQTSRIRLADLAKPEISARPPRAHYSERLKANAYE